MKIPDDYLAVLDDVVEHSNLGMVLLDTDLSVVWSNATLSLYLGSRPERGTDYRRFLESLDDGIFLKWPQIREQILKSFGEDGFLLGISLERPGGKSRLEYWSQPIRTGPCEGGRVEYFADVTTNFHVTQERERERSLLAAALESTADGILVVDERGRIVSFNQRFVEQWRIPPEVVDGKDDDLAIQFVLNQLTDPDAFVARVEEVYDDPEAESTDVLRFLDGRRFERYSRPQKINGKTVGRVWSFRDITQQTRLEETLRHSQKMDAMGQLAGGIAHDFNNLLTVIFGYGRLALDKLDKDDPVQGLVAEMAAAGDRAATLTRQLLAYSRRQILQPEVVEVNPAVEETHRMLGRLIGENIDLRLDLGTESMRIRVDRGQMDQVLLNLVLNARDAMPNGGTLTLRTRRTSVDAESDASDRGVKPGEYVTLAVTDTGVGIDPDTVGKVFDPFFTTKLHEGGTGLGLSTVYGIVKQSEGAILVDSVPGKGSTFTVYLPRTHEPLSEPEPAGGRAQRGSETVLVVEDEEAVRRFLVTVLEANGYRVIAAADGEEALRRCPTGDEALDLLLTDVVLPGMSGADVADRVRVRHPEVKVVPMSGYIGDAGTRARIHDYAEFLRKPFDETRLLKSVRRALSGS